MASRLFQKIRNYFRPVPAIENLVSTQPHPLNPEYGPWWIVDNMIPGESRMTGFGYFKTREEAQNFLRNLGHGLADSGYEVTEG